MRFVERDNSGRVVGHYAVPQPGRAEEALPDDHPDLLPPLAAVKAYKRAEIREAFENYLAPYKADFPPTERESWPSQLMESSAWVAWKAGGRQGAEPATPTLDAIAEYRGAPAGMTAAAWREALIEAALQKALYFQSKSGPAIGVRQRLEAQIDAIKTDTPANRAALAAIRWERPVES